MNLSFRLLTKQDVKTIYSWGSRLEKEVRSCFDDFHVGVGVLDSNRLIGFIVFRLPRKTDSKAARLRLVYVKPSYRRRGVASSLLIFTLALIDDEITLSNIYSLVDDRLLDVQLWLKKGGFVAVKTIRKRGADDQYLFTLDLKAVEDERAD